jgi:hypothetical protein
MWELACLFLQKKRRGSEQFSLLIVFFYYIIQKYLFVKRGAQRADSLFFFCAPCAKMRPSMCPKDIVNVKRDLVNSTI